MSGAVLSTINTRLDADAMAFIFQHAQSKVVLVDRVRRSGAGALSLTASPW
jgi:acyl-coenzyme A synthetase/AMP-(fatty) acid ligase